MAHQHKYSLTELYDMYPYERDIFCQMIADLIEKEKQDSQRLNA
jgi:hypothetical protein